MPMICNNNNAIKEDLDLTSVFKMTVKEEKKDNHSTNALDELDDVESSIEILKVLQHTAENTDSIGIEYEVRWGDGDDKEHMRNIPEWRKWLIVIILCMTTLEM
jgi:hypothetical protein